MRVHCAWRHLQTCRFFRIRQKRQNKKWMRQSSPRSLSEVMGSCADMTQHSSESWEWRWWINTKLSAGEQRVWSWKNSSGQDSCTENNLRTWALPCCPQQGLSPLWDTLCCSVTIQAMEPQGPKAGKALWDHQVQPQSSLSPVLYATSTWFLNTSRDSTTALGSLVQSLANLFEREFPLIPNLILPWHNLRPFLMEGEDRGDETISWIILSQLDTGIWSMNQGPRKWLKRYQQLFWDLSKHLIIQFNEKTMI